MTHWKRTFFHVNPLFIHHYGSTAFFKIWQYVSIGYYDGEFCILAPYLLMMRPSFIRLQNSTVSPGIGLKVDMNQAFTTI